MPTPCRLWLARMPPGVTRIDDSGRVPFNRFAEDSAERLQIVPSVRHRRHSAVTRRVLLIGRWHDSTSMVVEPPMPIVARDPERHGPANRQRN